MFKNTSTVKFSLVLGVTILFGALILASNSYAQEEVSEDSEEILTNSVSEIENGTSAENIENATEAIVDDSWFDVEQLTGTVDQGDFVVGPGRIELEIEPGQTVTRYMTVANRVSDDRDFEISVEDITGSYDNDQTVVLLGEEKGPYTLKDYITFPNNKFSLKLGERARIPVQITIPPDAEPGGRYGSVLISTVRINDNQVANVPRSPIIARVGTLFFITIPGDVDKEGVTKSINLTNNKWWYNKGPIDLGIVYENTGSVHLNPYGELRIKNLFNEEVGFVELEPWFALPDSLRTREVTWDREVLFGRYTATAFINRGYDDIVDEVSVSFWVLPWKTIGAIFLIIFIVFFSIRAFFRTFEFKRRG
ncbi:MAG: hypothetical protein R3B60_03225 [Candidatus Paceibacterota bacterium]